MKTLTPEQARFAQRLFHGGHGVTQDRLARLFKVDAHTIRQTLRTTGGRMDLTTLTDQERRFIQRLQGQAKRIIDEELRKYQLSIRTEMAAIHARIDTEIETLARRIDQGIAEAEAKENSE
jgi:uncharacterized protein YaaN involved in tellurite resistance